MRGVPGVVVLVLALAGCSGDGPEAEAVVPDDAASETISPDALVGQEDGTVTDTLFLAPPARLNTTSPHNLTLLAQLSGALPQSFAWNTTLNGTGNLTTVRLALWVDLQNSAVQSGIGGDPACSASLVLTVVANNTTVSYPGGCASLGTGILPPGEHRLDFSSPLLGQGVPGLAVHPGDQVVATVAFGFALPQGVGYVLGGGDRPSALQLAGLAEPVVPDATALL